MFTKLPEGMLVNITTLTMPEGKHQPKGGIVVHNYPTYHSIRIRQSVF